MMNETEARALLIIISEDRSDVLERTLSSVKNQTYRNLKVIIIDNNSVDGSYEKLIKYLNYDSFSLYRLKKRYIKTRLHRKLCSLIGYSKPDYVSIIEMGDVISPNYISTCVKILSDSENIRLILSEVDFIDKNGSVIHQEPVYKQDIIFTKGNVFIDLIKEKIGHKVIGFYDVHIFPRYYTDAMIFVDYYDFFKKIQFIEQYDIYYSSEKAALVCLPKYEDILEDIIFRYCYLLKFKIFRTIHNDGKYLYIDELFKNDVVFQMLSNYVLSILAKNDSIDEVTKKRLLDLSVVLSDKAKESEVLKL